MAKNLFEQFLSFAAGKLAGPIAHENIYKEEVSGGPTGVAKYLAKQEAAAKAKETAALPAGASSVEKYLARQAALAAQATADAVESAPQEPLTGVAKYLASQGKTPKSAVKAAAPAPAPTTGVGKYLAGQVSGVFNKNEAADPANTAQKKSVKPVAKAAIAPAKEKAEPVQAAPALASEPQSAAKKKSVINLDDGKQCQASTTKGSQCKHTTSLGHLQCVINKQSYQFTVCNQHNNESFKPYAPLVAA